MNWWYVLYFSLLTLAFVKSDWTGIFSDEPMDCTHAWEENHCYVCGIDR